MTLYSQEEVRRLVGVLKDEIRSRLPWDGSDAELVAAACDVTGAPRAVGHATLREVRDERATTPPR